MSARRFRSDKGATIVEFAFVGPVLFALLLGFIDFSLVIAGNSAGSNAVRDGARVGVLQYEGAHIPGSPNNLAIKNAVYARLGSMVKGTPIVDVTCVKADSGASIPCQRAQGDSGVELDRDLLQVTLTWTQIAVTPFVDSTHVERIRMTITGAPDFSPDASPLSVYFDDPDQDGVATPVNASETDGTVNLVLHRSGDSAPEVTVTLGAGVSSTAQPADYSFPTTVVFPSGVDQVTVPVQIVNDTEVEDPEVLIVEITAMTTNPANASAIVGLPVSVRVTIISDDVDNTPPVPSGPRTYSEVTGSIDGRVDALTIEFSEPVSNLGSWTLVTGPPGATIGAPVLGANPRAIRLPVSGAPIDTDGPWVVSATGVADAAGNTQATGNLSLNDAAPPVLVSVVSSGGTAGRAEAGDVVQFNFSEPVTVGAVGPLVLTNSGGNDTISITGLLGATSTTGGNYNSPNGNGGNPVDFAVTAVPSGSQLQLTLGACSPANNCNALATVGGTPTLGFVLSGPVGVNDSAAAVLPTAPLQALLF